MDNDYIIRTFASTLFMYNNINNLTATPVWYAFHYMKDSLGLRGVATHKEVD